MTLLDLFDGARRDRGAALAVNDVSYDALHLGALRVARRLAERGLDRGARIALYVENRLAFVYAYLAALRLGAIVVPTNVLYRAAELEHVVAHAGATLAVVSALTREHFENLRSGVPTLDASEIEACATEARGAPLDSAFSPPDDDVATIIYTSGTTGRSKGAMLTHGNLAAIAAQLVAAWRWRADDVLAVALPLFHMHGLGAALNGNLAAGGRLIVHERFEAASMLAELRRDDVTMFFGVPTMYVRLLETLGVEPAPSLRLWVSGSAALSADIHRAFAARFGSEILERYGSTEFGFALGNRYAGPRVPGSVGVPLPGTRVRIVAPGMLDPLPAEEVGELLVSGPTVFKGYWEQPEAAAAAFALDAEGTRWFRSGDLAQFDAADGVYRIVGRLKELIISGGFNVYPREIEAEIDRFPGVRASAVVAVADPARGELPVACIEAEGPFDSEALLAALRLRLASFKIPKAVYVLEELPRNALGKVEKQRLKEFVAGAPVS